MDPAVTKMSGVRYAVSGIDLSGRKGDAAKLSGIAKEVQTPSPPPVRFAMRDQQRPDRIEQIVEFGAMRVSQTPDFAGFHLPWQAGLRRSAVNR